MRTVWHYCIIAVPLVFAFSMLGTITDSILTKAVPSSDTGKTRQERSDWSFLVFESISHCCYRAPAHIHDECPVRQQIWLLCSWVQWVSVEWMDRDQWD